MKRVLIITYYWPPSGGGGVQRWLKFAKYFRDFGWEPVIYTPSNPEMPAVDESLLLEIPEGIEVIKHPIWEPFTLYKTFTGQKKDKRINTGFLSENEKPKFTEDLAVWIRGNFFVPDARKFWIKPSIKFLRKYLKNNPVDAIVSTGPPHSMHMIGLGIKKSMNIPWIADFRDPWTNIDFYQDLKLGKRADKLHHKLEKKILSRADAVTVVSPGMAKEFSTIVNREFSVITNGYDANDMKDLPNVKLVKDKFIISHIGSLTRTRNPENLWKALHELCEENVEFKKALEIHIVGKMDFSVTESIKNKNLKDQLVSADYLPHDKVLIAQRKANVLLLLVNDTPNSKLILTGKLFEYLAAQRPIICIGPKDGNAAEILEETKSGETFSFEQVDPLKNELLRIYQKNKTSELKTEAKNIAKYERKNLTKRMGQVLNSCIVSPQVSG